MSANKEPEEKEIVWLPKSLAKKVKELENSDNFVHEFIEESKRDLKNQIDTMDDEIIQYRANMIKARKEFEIAKNEMLEANYAIWDKFSEERKSLYNLSQKMVEDLKPLKDELNSLTKIMDSINKWGVKDLLDMVESISKHLSYNNSTTDVLKFLVENYKDKSSI